MVLPHHLSGALTRVDVYNALRGAGVRLLHKDGTAHGRQYYFGSTNGGTSHLFYTRGGEDAEQVLDAMCERLFPEQVVQICEGLGLNPQLFGWTWPIEEI